MYSIFIVDDKEIFRRKFKRFPIFRDNEQFQVKFEAQNGQEALDILRKEKIDLMITDIRMPIMGGLELLKIAKRENLCPCIVLLSEYSDFSYAKQGIVLGAFDYIVKPIEEDVLASLLKRCADYLNTFSPGLEAGSNVVQLLPQFLLKDDEYADTLSKRIVNDVVKYEPENLAHCWEELNDVLRKLRKKISEERPYMEMYCNFDELFWIEEAVDMKQLGNSFERQMILIRKEINKFSVQTKNELIQTVCNMIVRNIEDNLSLQNIANLHFVNKAYLSHLFKQELGISFVEYLTTVKMERAKMLLEHSSMKVYEVSSRLGYNDTEYFSRLFKQSCGLTPSEFRQRLGK